MGQKIHPLGFRVGITEGWTSRWFAPKKIFGDLLVEDQKIRAFIDEKLNRQAPFAGIAKVEIERTREELRVVLHSSRPGTVIGPKGADADKLRDALETLTGRKVKIEVSEVANPDLNAQLIAENIGEQLKKRVSFRRAVRQKLDAAMSAGAKGVKIQLAGRIGGAEIARTEKFLLGSIPLQTLQADVNYGLNHCRTPYGVLGIKVWVYRGLYSETENLDNTRKSGPRRPRRR